MDYVCHAFADANDVITRQLLTNARSATLKLQRFSSFVVMTHVIMMAELRARFNIPPKTSASDNILPSCCMGGDEEEQTKESSPDA